MSYERLSSGEVAALVALRSLGGEATAQEISERVGMDIQYARNVLRKLELKGLVRGLRSIPGAKLFSSASTPFGNGVRGRAKGRLVIWVLNVDFDTLVEMYRKSFERYASSLGVDMGELYRVVEGEEAEVTCGDKVYLIGNMRVRVAAYSRTQKGCQDVENLFSQPLESMEALANALARYLSGGGECKVRLVPPNTITVKDESKGIIIVLSPRNEIAKLSWGSLRSAMIKACHHVTPEPLQTLLPSQNERQSRETSRTLTVPARTGEQSREA